MSLTNLNVELHENNLGREIMLIAKNRQTM